LQIYEKFSPFDARLHFGIIFASEGPKSGPSKPGMPSAGKVEAMDGRGGFCRVDGQDTVTAKILTNSNLQHNPRSKSERGLLAFH
jgi:hypothetical protein